MHDLPGTHSGNQLIKLGKTGAMRNESRAVDAG
jgi:hypothetical protein